MNKCLSWLNQRLPLVATWQKHLSRYPAPKNLNIYYIFGALALLVLANQLLTGLWLTMFYTPTAKDAFSSVEFIMRDVHGGWLLRYMHSTGASMFFIVVYLHMFRALLYGSYGRPRELVWLLGMGLFVLLMMEAFFGYLLPWGQMSYWGAEVITSLFSAVPYIGDQLVIWIRGDYSVSTATLQRFFALHVIGVPLLLIGFVYLHLIALHHVGSNNPDGIDIKSVRDPKGWPLDAIPFYPYYVVKDLFFAVIFLILFFLIIFFFPDFYGYFLEPDNFVPADPMTTPAHIVPAWYLTPFYSILRAIPNKQLGVLAMFLSIALLFCLPWLDRHPVRSMRYKGVLSRLGLLLFVTSFLVLGYLGMQDVTPVTQLIARMAVFIYFLYFISLTISFKFERSKTLPERLTK